MSQSPALAAAACSASAAPGSPALAELLRGGRRFVGAPADRHRAGLPRGERELAVAGRVGLRAERDDVGELGDRRQVADRRQPREAERVEAVAGEQREVGVGDLHARGRP